MAEHAGGEAPASKKIYEFVGKQVDAVWDGRLCIHVGECTRAKGEIFVSGRQPWGQPDRVSADEVTEVITRCPTGALVAVRKDGGVEEVAPASNTIRVVNNGPLYAVGDLAIDGAAADMPGVRFRAALCRCGLSRNKPFCDNAHESGDFCDRGAVGDSPGEFETEGGRLEIKRAPNGPLLVTGSFALVASSGRTAWRGTRAALCRCGASKSKPFCDGAHTAIGFEAE